MDETERSGTATNGVEQASLMDNEDQKRSLRSLQPHLDSNHPGLTEALDRLAAEYRRRGKEREAKKLSRRVLKIWEGAFVPEYGWRHFLSDLFGGELTRVRPSLKFAEETVLQLTPDLLLGTGDNRCCYGYPGDPSRCIKVDKAWNPGVLQHPTQAGEEGVDALAGGFFVEPRGGSLLPDESPGIRGGVLPLYAEVLRDRPDEPGARAGLRTDPQFGWKLCAAVGGIFAEVS